MELKEKYSTDDLLAIIRRLRQPDGCPWDKVQTHQSIKKDLIEETYEAVDALDKGDDKAFANELGDVLLQVAFHSVLGEERGAFDFDDVLREVCVKLITRHTHVFGEDHAGNVEEALTNWEKNKKKEKNLTSCTAVLRDVPIYYPALMRASKVKKKAGDFGFDWKTIDPVYDKIAEETDELKEAAAKNDADRIREEYGDLLFATAVLGRFLGTDPESALAAATNKFIDRFGFVEKEAAAEGKDIAEMPENELNALWQASKKRQKNK